MSSRQRQLIQLYTRVINERVAYQVVKSAALEVLIKIACAAAAIQAIFQTIPRSYAEFVSGVVAGIVIGRIVSEVIYGSIEWPLIVEFIDESKLKAAVENCQKET